MAWHWKPAIECLLLTPLQKVLQCKTWTRLKTNKKKSATPVKHKNFCFIPLFRKRKEREKKNMFYSLRPEIRLNIKAPSIEEFPISPPLSHHHSGGGGDPGGSIT